MDVSKSIRKLRESHDLTQEQFGEIAGVSAMAVSQWENGRAVPRMGAIQRISDFFGCPKSMIMGDADESGTYRSASSDERELIRIFRNLNAHGRDQLMVFARGCAASFPLNQVDSMGA